MEIRVEQKKKWKFYHLIEGDKKRFLGKSTLAGNSKVFEISKDYSRDQVWKIINKGSLNLNLLLYRELVEQKIEVTTYFVFFDNSVLKYIIPLKFWKDGTIEKNPKEPYDEQIRLTEKQVEPYFIAKYP